MTEDEDLIFWKLVGKKVSGEISKEEHTQLNSLLEKFPELLYTLETIGYYWNSQKENEEFKEREAALQKHLQRLDALILNEEVPVEQPVVKMEGKNSGLYRRLALAAAIISIALVSTFFFRDHKEVKLARAFLPMETIVALKGSKNHFILPDGSTVWLNAGTRINYQSSLNTDSVREVFLTGEAYFDIRHDPNHPFWIHTSKMDIRDIGTSFNVKAYPSDTVTEATLVEGSIQVKTTNGKTFTTLSRANEKITVHSNLRNDSTLIKDLKDTIWKERLASQTLKISTTISPVDEDSVLAETAWLKGMMIFRNESFEDLAVRMERWYNVTISFEKSEYKKYRLSGTFNNETIEQALKVLQSIKSFSFTINNNKIIISE